MHRRIDSITVAAAQTLDRVRCAKQARHLYAVVTATARRYGVTEPFSDLPQCSGCLRDKIGAGIYECVKKIVGTRSDLDYRPGNLPMGTGIGERAYTVAGTLLPMNVVGIIEERAQVAEIIYLYTLSGFGHLVEMAHMKTHSIHAFKIIDIRP